MGVYRELTSLIHILSETSYSEPMAPTKKCFVGLVSEDVGLKSTPKQENLSVFAFLCYYVFEIKIYENVKQCSDLSTCFLHHGKS